MGHLNEKLVTKIRAVVITPTTGADHLAKAVESVRNQTYLDLMHVIVVDGDSFVNRTDRLLDTIEGRRVSRISLPFNTGSVVGALKFNGHRIYASIPLLINAEYIFFLDEDNWYDKEHVSSLIDLMENEKLDWAYSLRKIYDHRERYIDEDNCESLGRWAPFSGRANLVDTSCYAFRADVLIRICHHWYHPLGADRFFYSVISKEYPNFRNSALYSVNYRLKPDKPPFAEFFRDGNECMLKKFDRKLPWLNCGRNI